MPENTYRLLIAFFAGTLHLFSMVFNLLLFLTVTKYSYLLNTNKYVYHMILAEILLNLTQIIAIEPSLWFGFDAVIKYNQNTIVLGIVTVNQAVFWFRYYLCVLIAVHRAVIIIIPRKKHLIGSNVGLLILAIWTYMIVMSIIYIPLGCIRYYEPVDHRWNTTCTNENSTAIHIWRGVTSYVFTYIPHLTLVINGIAFCYVSYYKFAFRKISRVSTVSGGGSNNLEYQMLWQSLLLALILAFEPFCFFIYDVVNLVFPYSVDHQLRRFFDYSMTYISDICMSPPLASWYPPDNFTIEQLEYEKQTRLLQPIWDYIRVGNEHILSSPLFPPIYALSIDYTWVIVFTIIDLFFQWVPFFKNNKIQKNRQVSWALIKPSLHLQMWNQLLCFMIYPMALVQLIWVPDTELPELAPTVFELVSQNLIFFLAFDFSYFWFHYAHHKIKFLYRWCHSVHHMYSSPFAAAAQHLHPFELFFVGSFITTVPWIFPTHCLTYWLWFLVAQSVSYEVHIGYDFPFALHRWFPFYSGAPAHDMHHFRPLTCFEPWLNYLDKIMGSHITYEDLKRMAAEKSKRFGLYSKEDVQDLQTHN